MPPSQPSAYPVFDPPSLVDWVAAVKAEDDIKWLVPGLVPAKSLTIIAGRPKFSHKSWLGYALAYAISSGKKVGFIEPAAAFTTVYLNGEGQNKALAERFEPKFVNTYKIPLHHCDMRFAHGKKDYPIDLDNEASMAPLLDHIEAYDVKCLFVDTLNRYMTGNENDGKDMSRVLRNIATIQELGCAVVLIHHSRKGDSIKKRPKRPFDVFLDPDINLRGSSVLAAGYDHIISIESFKDRKKFFNVALVGGKNSDYKEFEINWEIDDALETARLKMAEWQDDEEDPEQTCTL